MNENARSVTFALDRPKLAELDRFQRTALATGVAALLVSAVGARFSPAQFFHSYLIGYMFIVGLTLGCLAILMLQHLSGGAWGLVIRRPLESATRTLPVVAILFVPIAIGLTDLYPWARADEVAKDGLLQAKRLYLNPVFFFIRATVYFAGWMAFAYWLNRLSRQQDGAAPPPGRLFRVVSAPGLLFYVLTVTFASIDWVMSLTPHWFSTMFGVLFMGGQVLSAMAFVIAVLFLLSDAEPISSVVTPAHFHDLGKLLLAFVMLWAYFSFSQLLIIWSGNLPEEIPFYLDRTRGGWQWVALLLVLGHFALPFFLLLSRDLKRHARVLAKVAIALMVMRVIDLFWMIAPSYSGAAFRVHWLDVVAPAGLVGLWLAAFVWQLKTAPILPVNDPYFQEALHAQH